jgi:hypothetical protein
VCEEGGREGRGEGGNEREGYLALDNSQQLYLVITVIIYKIKRLCVISTII